MPSPDRTEAHRTDAGPLLHDPDELRRACATVVADARHVRLEPAMIAALATDLIASDALDDAGAVGDPWVVSVEDPERAIALVLTLAAINFGSGWHPVITKRPGMSGATSMATALREWEAAGPITADRLRSIERVDAAAILGQSREDDEIVELTALFAAAMSGLGSFVADRFDGSFSALVDAANGSAVALATTLATMPAFDDVATWRSPDGATIELHFDKRAQLAAADLHRAFAGRGPGRFDDLDRLTAFADNLVPHVLFIDGVVSFEPSLRERIDRGDLLVAGSNEEIEIRASAVRGVELLHAELRARGIDVPEWRLDGVLWRRGGGPVYKAIPRHRARSSFY